MSRLSENIQIGKMTLTNRLVMPPMATRNTDAGDNLSDEVYDYYLERARFSKVSLIIVEHCYIHPQGKAHIGQLSLARDENIAALSRLTWAVHQQGVKILAQISHAGSAASSSVTGQPIAAPSALANPKRKGEIPEALTKAQIQEIVSWFAQAAWRAKEAGFDGVEVHSAHGYLLNQFYSPLSNQRTDEYGPQSIENRLRIHKEVISAIRESTGSDFAISVRLGGCDYEAGGSTIEDAVKASQFLKQQGVDLIHLSGGMNGYIHPESSEPGYFKDMAQPIRKAVHIPVLLTGGVTTPEQAEALLNEGVCDLVGVGRAIFKDAHWADQKTEQ